MIQVIFPYRMYGEYSDGSTVYVDGCHKPHA